MSGHVIAQIISISLVPVLTRLFEPEVFGTAALYQSIASVLAVFACLRYELSIVIAEKDEDANHILVLCLCTALMVSLISFFLVFGFRNPVSRALNSPSLAGYLWLIPISVLVRGMTFSFANWNTRHKNFGHLASSRIVASVGTHSTRLGTGFAGWTSADMLILSTIIGNTLTCLMLGWKACCKGIGIFKSVISIKALLYLAAKHRKFPLFNTWSACISVISLELPNWFFAYFFSPIIVGYYAIARTALMIPMITVGRALSRVFYQKSSEMHNKDKSAGIAAVELFRFFFIIGILPTFALSLVAEDVFGLIFGARWAPAGLYVQILSYWMFFQFLFSPLSFLLYVLQRQDMYLMFEALLLALRFLVLLAGSLTGSMIYTLILFSVINSACYIIFIVKIFSLMNINILHELKPVLKYVILLSVFFASIVLVKHNFYINSSIHFLLIFIGCAIYYGTLYRNGYFKFRLLF